MSRFLFRSSCKVVTRSECRTEGQSHHSKEGSSKFWTWCCSCTFKSTHNIVQLSLDRSSPRSWLSIRAVKWCSSLRSARNCLTQGQCSQIAHLTVRIKSLRTSSLRWSQMGARQKRRDWESFCSSQRHWLDAVFWMLMELASTVRAQVC